MSRSIAPGVRRFAIFVTFLCLPSCVESKYPISDPDQSKLDLRLVGAWRDVDKESARAREGFLFIGRAAYAKCPPGLMTVLLVGHNKDKTVHVKRLMDFFPTRLGQENYANCFQGYSVPGSDVGPRWDRSRVGNYVFMKYAVQGDRLTVWKMSAAAAEATVSKRQLAGLIEERGLLKWKTILLTDDRALSRFLMGHGGRVLFPDAERMCYTRIW